MRKVTRRDGSGRQAVELLPSSSVANQRARCAVITLTREEAQQVLDALQCATPPTFSAKIVEDWQSAVELLRARLAQSEPEPVAWHEPGSYSNVTVYKKWAEENKWLPLYKERT